VLQNVIGNALKYHSTGRTPEVHVSADKRDGMWIIAVADNGIGIAPDFHDQIFQPFRRLHGRAEYSGTGMGLAICRKIVQSGGGEIWVGSAEGRGSRFFFSIPDYEDVRAGNDNPRREDA
jgi:signal transduction histidine kinase